jgi:SagB-type dehydrogenase family enzyme
VTDAAFSSTLLVATTIYDGGPDLDDPAEVLHEASKLQPSLVQRQLRGVARLEADPTLISATARAVRRNRTLPRVPLPAPALPPLSLDEALRTRRSTRRFGDRPVELEHLATLLWSAYGVVPGGGRTPRRASPSAGGLYPLELFVLSRNVDGIATGVYHYDPLDQALERMPVTTDGVELSPLVDELETAAAIVILTAVFWRSRFKYGLRGYRFTLLEAGHVAQNLVLAATALGLGSIVLGGFYDARVDAVLALDGVDESTLIMVSLGWPPG